MPVRTQTQNIDNLYIAAWQKRLPTTIDQIFEATAFWNILKAKGGIKPDAGGSFIEVPLSYGKNDTITWLKRGGTVPIQDKEFLTAAKYEWKYVAVSVVRFWQDEQKYLPNKQKFLNLVESKLQNAQDSLADEFERALFGSGTNDDFEGLGVQIPDDPTSGTVGGIDASTYTWWRSNAINATGKSMATYLRPYMRTMMNNCSKNKKSDLPDIIVTTQTVYEAYEDMLTDFFRFTKDTPNLAWGEESIPFMRASLIWAPSCPAQKMYFVNTKYLYLMYDPNYWFEMTEWKPIPEQPNDRVAQITCVANIVCSRRASQGVIYNLDTE